MSATDHPDDLLSAYLDGELPAEASRQVEAHLVRCGSCSAELDDLDAARRLLRTLPPVPAPPGFIRGVVERRQRSMRRATTLVLVAASVAVVVGLTVADPAGDEPSPSQTLSLAGDAPRLDTGATPSPFAPTTGADEPLGAPGAEPGAQDGPATTAGPDGTDGTDGTTATTGPVTGPTATGSTTTTTATAENDTGSEEPSDPVTLGDRLDEIATNLLELIGG